MMEPGELRGYAGSLRKSGGHLTAEKFEQAADALEAALLRISEANRALFEPLGSDASYNLQGALHDLRHTFDPNDGGVIAGTVDRVIEQIEKVRAVLSPLGG